MPGRRFWEIGGFVAGAVLIAFGVVAIYMGVDGYTTVGTASRTRTSSSARRKTGMRRPTSTHPSGTASR